ncbi:MAG: HDOD domain-containing protein [Planctomycetota bacterium]
MTSATSDLSRVFEQQIAARRIELPPMPGTATEVMALCQLESTDAAKLSAVIHRDQTIASNVLRVANSAAYMGQIPCSSLRQACSRLGMQVVMEIVMAVSVRGRMFGDRKHAKLLSSLWQHSVLTAFFTKEIARLRRRNVEIAFLCGLLHDVGKAALLDNVDKMTAENKLEVSTEALIAAIAEHHIEVGVLLAREWKLPEQITESIQFHHDAHSATRFQDMAMTVCLADLLAHLAAPGPFAEPPTEEELKSHPALVVLNLYAEQMQQLLEMRERALQVTEGLR